MEVNAASHGRDRVSLTMPPARSHMPTDIILMSISAHSDPSASALEGYLRLGQSQGIKCLLVLGGLCWKGSVRQSSYLDLELNFRVESSS